MAKSTLISAVAGAPAIGQKIQVMQRLIDFAVTGLASGDHFELFTLEEGDAVIGGSVQVTTVAGAGNEDLTIGIGGTGTQLLTATAVDTTAGKTFTGTYAVGADTVDLAMTVEAADRGTVLVTIAVLKAAKFG